MSHPFFFELIDQNAELITAFFEDSLKLQRPNFSSSCPYFEEKNTNSLIPISLVDLGSIQENLREKDALAQIAGKPGDYLNSLYFENDFKRGGKEIEVPIDEDRLLNLYQNPLLGVQNILVHELFHLYYREYDPNFLYQPYVESLAAWIQNRFDEVGLSYPFFKNWQNTNNAPPFAPQYPGYRDFMVWGALEEQMGIEFVAPLLKQLTQDPILCKEPAQFAPLHKLLQDAVHP